MRTYVNLNSAVRGTPLRAGFRGPYQEHRTRVRNLGLLGAGESMTALPLPGPQKADCACGCGVFGTVRQKMQRDGLRHVSRCTCRRCAAPRHKANASRRERKIARETLRGFRALSLRRALGAACTGDAPESIVRRLPQVDRKAGVNESAGWPVGLPPPPRSVVGRKPQWCSRPTRITVQNAGEQWGET